MKSSDDSNFHISYFSFFFFQFQIKLHINNKVKKQLLSKTCLSISKLCGSDHRFGSGCDGSPTAALTDKTCSKNNSFPGLWIC